MHPDEVDTDASLVRRLLRGQFPHWAELPIERFRSAGTDNAIYRLGDEMSVRLPRVEWSAGQPQKDQTWLPKLAPLLPLAIPEPFAVGVPAEGYPWHWSVQRWIEGEIATAETVADPIDAATVMARFVTALHAVDPRGGPPAGRARLTDRSRDERTRESIAAVAVEFDAAALTAAWDAALATPAWEGAPVWVHGDAYDGNLLARDGRLCAVIDFSGVGLGDPACDLIVAWSLFSGESRDAFRAAVAVDDATWARGRGWALSVSLIALPYYRDTNPVMVANARHRIAEVLADARFDG